MYLLRPCRSRAQPLVALLPLMVLGGLVVMVAPAVLVLMAPDALTAVGPTGGPGGTCDAGAAATGGPSGSAAARDPADDTRSLPTRTRGRGLVIHTPLSHAASLYPRPDPSPCCTMLSVALGGRSWLAHENSVR